RAPSTAAALPPCVHERHAPEIIAFHKKAFQNIGGALDLQGIVRASDAIKKPDFFVGGRPAMTINSSSTGFSDIEDAGRKVEFSIPVRVGLSVPGQRGILVTPGATKLHLLATTKSGKCRLEEIALAGTRPRIFALIIGVARYDRKQSGLEPLQYAYEDAKKFRDYLKTTLLVPEENIVLLPSEDGAGTADVTSIRGVFEDWANKPIGPLD